MTLYDEDTYKYARKTLSLHQSGSQEVQFGKSTVPF